MRCRTLLIFGLALIFAACSDSEDGDNGGPPFGGEDRDPVSVEAIQAGYGALPLEERISGVVRADNQVSIYPDIDAPVVEVLARDGQFVNEGQPLVRLRDTQVRQQLRQAEADLKVAEADARSARADLGELESRLERTEQLADRDFESREELERLRAEVESAEAAVEQAEANVDRAESTVEEREEDLAQTVVRAPISGYVGNRNAEVGMRADPSTELFMLGNLDTVRVQISITDRMLNEISVGQTAQITAPTLPDTAISAEVSRISPFLDAGTYSARAEIDVPNPGGLLRAGMFVTADIAYGEAESATIVPKAALYEDPTGTRGVYVSSTLNGDMDNDVGDAPDLPTTPTSDVDDDHEDPSSNDLSDPTAMQFVDVDIVAEGRELAGVTGIDEGDWVVTVGHDLLYDAPGDEPEARVRPMSWNRILSLQRYRDQDLLERFMERHQEVASMRFGEDADSSAD